MKKPNIGDLVSLKGDQIDGTFVLGRVVATYDSIDVWWDSDGEDKMALLEALGQYGPEKAATAEWYAVVDNAEYPGESMAVASFECDPCD